tara:strand:+ start:366 stop:767 length:402 start_codon:yes stop_codon:yes gene_type:complete
MDLNLNYYNICSGIISGIILFQSSVVAPSVFRTLKPEAASAFLRAIFPKMFMYIVAFGIVSLAILTMEGNYDSVQLYVSCITIIGSGLCYLLIPQTNKARDDGDETTFTILHTISVIITISILLLNVFWQLIV